MIMMTTFNQEVLQWNPLLRPLGLSIFLSRPQEQPKIKHLKTDEKHVCRCYKKFSLCVYLTFFNVK